MIISLRLVLDYFFWGLFEMKNLGKQDFPQYSYIKEGRAHFYLLLNDHNVSIIEKKHFDVNHNCVSVNFFVRFYRSESQLIFCEFFCEVLWCESMPLLYQIHDEFECISPTTNFFGSFTNDYPH